MPASVDRPAPDPDPTHAGVSGTERMLVEFGKANWIEKARLQPEKVRMVFDKARTDGLLPTLEAVRNKLDQPLPMGYCNVGEVIALGAGVAGFQVGDPVASNGRHAEVVAVPQNLCAKVPEAVEDDAAAFTVIGAVALQGIRLVQPTLGETVVVTGLGLIGLITVQLLRAHGCRVLGLDFDHQRLELARSFGAAVVDLGAERDPVGAAQLFSRGRGVDAVLITASTDSSEPVHQAARMCRKRGRIVLVGVTGTDLSRADFYEKELSFQVSCSYGPGRYDPDYEEMGRDYPIGFVRWTEQRNFEAFLDMLAEGRVDVSPLISHRFAVVDAAAAYAVVGGSEPSLGVLLDYPRVVDASTLRSTVVLSEAPEFVGGRAAVSFVGSGNYASSVLIPAFRKTGAALISVASNAGVSGVHAGRKFGFLETTTDLEQVFGDARSTAVVIVTRHDSHAALVLKAIAAGKHVFVEKPLCLTLSELESIEEAARGSGRLLMVGFNRRFAPQVGKLKQLLAGCDWSEGLRNDGERWRDSRTPLDARPVHRWWSYCWGSMPFHRPAALPLRQPHYDMVAQRHERHDCRHGDTATWLCRWFYRNDSLFRQWDPGPFQRSGSRSLRTAVCCNSTTSAA
jgi:threonine dehydrogenase-like Zn-dependent dehydrogenase